MDRQQTPSQRQVVSDGQPTAAASHQGIDDATHPISLLMPSGHTGDYQCQSEGDMQNTRPLLLYHLHRLPLQYSVDEKGEARCILILDNP